MTVSPTAPPARGRRGGGGRSWLGTAPPGQNPPAAPAAPALRASTGAYWRGVNPSSALESHCISDRLVSALATCWRALQTVHCPEGSMDEYGPSPSAPTGRLANRSDVRSRGRCFKNNGRRAPWQEQGSAVGRPSMAGAVISRWAPLHGRSRDQPLGAPPWQEQGSAVGRTVPQPVKPSLSDPVEDLPFLRVG